MGDCSEARFIWCDGIYRLNTLGTNISNKRCLHFKGLFGKRHAPKRQVSSAFNFTFLNFGLPQFETWKDKQLWCLTEI